MEISLEALIAYLCIAGFIVLYILPKLTASRWIQRAKNGMLEDIGMPKRWLKEIEMLDLGPTADYFDRVVKDLKIDMQVEIEEGLRQNGKLLLEALGELLGNYLMEALDPQRLKSTMIQSLGAIKGQLTQSATSEAVSEDMQDIQEVLAETFGPHIIERMAEKHPVLALAAQFGTQHPDMVRELFGQVQGKSGSRARSKGVTAGRRKL